MATPATTEPAIKRATKLAHDIRPGDVLMLPRTVTEVRLVQDSVTIVFADGGTMTGLVGTTGIVVIE